MKLIPHLIIKKFKFFLLIFLLSLCSCSTHKQAVEETPVKNTDLINFKFSVEDAPEWTNLFKRTSGWFGADGIFSIPENGIDNDTNNTQTVLLFSDTMIGEIKDGKAQPGFTMIHNSVGILDGSAPIEDNLKFYWAKKLNGAPESLFIPSTPISHEGEYYWLGDGFVNHEMNDNTYIFGYRMKDIPGVNTFGFEQVGSTFIIIPKGSKPPFTNARQIDNPLFVFNTNITESMAFGSAILDNSKKAGITNGDGFVYVYGVRGADKNLVAARVLPADFEKADSWTFWNGSAWINDINGVANITNHVSNELSVTPLADGRYAMFFQVDGLSSKIGLRLGSSPVGPFGPIIEIYDCKNELENVKGIFAYNAKAHPALSKPGELLISYNVNSFDFFSVITDNPNLYRPRFITVKY